MAAIAKDGRDLRGGVQPHTQTKSLGDRERLARREDSHDHDYFKKVGYRYTKDWILRGVHH